jgi:hypothetical protein
MNTLNKSLLSLGLGMLGVLSLATLQAQTTTVLDSFSESTAGMPPGTTTNGFTPGRCTFHGKGGGPSGTQFCNTNISLFPVYSPFRSPATTMTQYTATGPNDPFVSEGSNSMAITFYQQGFAGSDFQIVLSDANSLLVEQSAQSGQIGRYILRYDMIFSNPSQYSYFNQNVFIGDDQDYLSIGGAAPNGTNSVLGVYSCALELPALHLPSPGSGTNVEFYFANNFATTQTTFTNCTIYIDNIRLVDTYASNSTPVIYPLLSFKNGIGVATNLYPQVASFYGNPTSDRTHLFLYQTNGLYNSATNGIPYVCTGSNHLAFLTWVPSTNDTDFAVTESDGYALGVSNYCTGTGRNTYQADFQISFAGTKLAQILSQNLPLPQLAHYTLRWDVSMPEVWSIADGNYVNFTYSTGLAALPMCQGRRETINQTGLQRLTYSTTLDQIAAWGGSPVGGDPAIVCFSDSSDMAGPLFYYFDNFQLIDTAPVSPTITITSYTYNPVTRQFTLTWTSQPGANYTIQTSANLLSGFTSLVTNIPSGGTTTTYTVTLPAGNMGYLRVFAQ